MRRLIALGMLLFLPASAFGADASIRVGEASVELSLSQVSERMIHLEISPLDEQGHVKPEPASTVLVPFQSTEKLRLRELAASQDVQIGGVRVTLKPNPLSVSVWRADGKLVQEFGFDAKDGAITFRTDAPVFGLGGGRQQFDRRGNLYDMRNGQNAMLGTNGATFPVPFLIGANGWAIFIHNPPPATPSPKQAWQPWGQFDLRDPSHGHFIPRPESLMQMPLHLFIMVLDHPSDALEEYVRLTGHPAMPPKWVMGYFQSHRSLADSTEPIAVASTFREKKLPCDALIYLGSGYTNGQTGWNLGHGSLEFNPKTFDKPGEMLNTLHDLNFKVILHKNAAPVGLFGASMAEESDSPLHIKNYWATHRPDVALGVDGWWPDDGDELPVEARLARLRCYYEGPLLDHPNERPWSLNRNGYAGAARYGAWIWSGDVQSRWATLAAHVPVGLNFSLSASPFWGTDTGGFVPTSELTGELYVRWFQFSVFNPLFRSHGRTWHLRLPWGWNTGDPGPIESPFKPDPAELHNAEVEPICRKYLELRYQLLPYNYTLIRQACDTGLPPMRALWLHYPDDEIAMKLGDEYLWGRDLLVAPVVEKGEQSRHLYLPAGQWYDWWTGEKLSGARWIDRTVDLATIPLYVRAGGIIPIDPVRQFTAQIVDEPTVIRVYPGANGVFTLYDDDGHSEGYKDGTDARMIFVRFEWDNNARRLSILPDERMKHWPGGGRVFKIQVVGGEAKSTDVEFKGERVDVSL
ncbi:MAG TPA: TIM-barrel domain-containing protein [Tepidisphaeraceae bacterium]|jgi:alpha-glucosidase/alpha-D-xyloside xylohydrolase|nr:TIM-barrel domain-containing protein [Tepidisphaeraceae bacterium]